MDFHALPRRDLQALCKRNAIRANMSNAAMADALRSLQSVKGIDEIRTAAPPEMSAVKSPAEEVAGEDQRHGCPLPRGGRSQATARRAAANKTDEGVPVSETLQTEEGAPRDVTVTVETEAVSTGKGRTRRSKRSKVKETFEQKEEAAAAEQKVPMEPTLLEMKLAEEVAGEQQRHGCPLPRCGRSQAATKIVAASKAEEGALVSETSQTSQNTTPRDATLPVEMEAASPGKRRTRRSKRSKVKETLDQKEEAVAEHKEPTEPTLLEMKSVEEVGGEEPRHRCPLPHPGRSQAMASKVDEAALTTDTLQRSQQNTAARDAAAPVDAEAVSTGKRRTRRSSRSKGKMVSDQKGEEVAAQREPIEPTLFEENSTVEEEHHHGCPLPRGGRGRATRSRAAAPKTEDATPVPDTLQRTQKTAAQETAVHMEMEEVSTGKKRTRRSRRSKVQVALVKKEEAAAVANKEPIEKRCDDPKEEAAVDEEADKHQDGEMHFENPSICSGKRQKRRSRRQKVKMALDNKEEVAATVGKELIADSSSGVIGSVVVSDSSNKEEKVDVVEVGAKNFQEGIIENLEPTSTVKKSPSLATGGPVIEVAQDASVRGGGSSAESYTDEMAVKINPAPENKDGFSLAGEPDQSYLLVNTLDRFVKPMCKFPVKETKQGECWWMLV